MKNTNEQKESAIESALAMYRETVSPSRSMLSSILTQIPERKIANTIKIPENVRAIRSPYIWLAFTQAVTVSVILLALMPTLSEKYLYRNDPFYEIDRQVDSFERTINEEDARMPLVDYTNNSL